jgi:hypothetical protein
VSIEGLTRMDDDELGRALRALEPMLAPVHAPDVSSEVVDAIRSGRTPRRGYSRGVRVAILVAAALLLLASAAVAARLVIDVGGIRIEPPPTSPSVSRPPLVGPAFGVPTTLEEAQHDAGFVPIIPRTLGRPDRVWLARGDEPPSMLLAMAWFPRPDLPRIPGTPYGASLLEVHGDAELVAKHVGAGGFREIAPDVFWIQSPHVVELLTGGETRAFSVTGHVLIWQEGDLALRLESNLPRPEALRLAGLTG